MSNDNHKMTKHVKIFKTKKYNTHKIVLKLALLRKKILW